jgi:hypothetical protein
MHHLSWLTPRRFAEVRALAIRMNEVLEAGRRERTGELYEALAVVTPVTRRRGSHSKPQKPAAVQAPKARRTGGRR